MFTSRERITLQQKIDDNHKRLDCCSFWEEDITSRYWKRPSQSGQEVLRETRIYI